MNERIQQLAEQATSLYQTMDGEWEEDFDKEKFAELIVRECVKILVTSEGNENTSDAVWDLEELGVDVSKILNTIRS